LHGVKGGDVMAKSATAELDLHGYAVDEALDLFVGQYNRQAGTFCRMVVVHGYGSTGKGGVIGRKLRVFLARHNVTCVRGEAVDGNPGYTIVDCAGHVLPTYLESRILEYCASARSEKKTMGKFRHCGDSQVKAGVSELVRRNQLRRFWKGERTFLETVPHPNDGE
jgi:hypothetical protein